MLKVQSQSITKAEGRLKEELEKKKERLMDERRKKENEMRILKKEQIKKERKSVKTAEKMLEKKDTKVRFVDKTLSKIIKYFRFPREMAKNSRELKKLIR